MSKRNDLSGAIANRQLDNAMYSGEGLPDNLFDDLDTTVVTSERIEKLESQIESSIFLSTGSGGLMHRSTGICLDALGAHVPEEIDIEVLLQFGDALFTLQDTLQLWIGDWLSTLKAYGYSVQYTAQKFKRDTVTLEQYERVCNSTPKPLRRANLLYSHYQLVASKKFDDRRGQLLLEASEASMTVDDFRLHIAEGERPTPPAAKVLMGVFSRMEKKVNEYVEAVGEGDRKQLADWLRRLADKLDK